MSQLKSYEVKEAIMALEKGGVVIDASELERLVMFQEVSEGYEKRIAKLERALRKAERIIDGLKGSE